MGYLPQMTQMPQPTAAAYIVLMDQEDELATDLRYLLLRDNCSRSLHGA